MCKIIVVANQKGGVGKTTTVVNLSAGLAAMDKKILVIDLDPQGNSSTGFGINHIDRECSIYQVLIMKNHISEAIFKSILPNLDIITANSNLSAAELELFSLKNREYILLESLKLIKNNYDYIFIDSPPALNLLTINALTAADEILIPMQCEFYSLEGLSHLLKTIELVSKNLNKKIKICGILFTMYDKRNRLTEAVEADVKNCLGNLVFETKIPRNIKISEAPSYGKPAIIYDHRCLGAVAYMQLTKEFLVRQEEDNAK